MADGGAALVAITVPFTGFDIPIEIVVIGIISGMVYGVLGHGLTLIYRSVRIINFAHAGVGAVASAILVRLVLFEELPYGLGLATALVAAVAAGAAVEFLVIRRLMRAPRLVVMIATIAVALILSAAASALQPSLSGGNAGQAQRILSGGGGYPTPFQADLSIGNLRLGSGEILILLVVPIITAALTLFLRRSKLGVAAMAAAENLEAARLAGVPARRISLTVWILAALLSAVAVILIGPTRPPVATFELGPELMIRALAAALLGGLTSFPGVFVGGLVVGVTEAVTVWNYQTGGVVEVVIFGLILAAMFLRRELGRAGRGSEESSWSLAGTTHALEDRIAALPRVRLAKAVLVVAAVVAVVAGPWALASSTIVLLSGIVLFATMGLSITVLTGFSGQVSLAQFMFVVLGGAIGGRLLQLGYPGWVGVVYAIVGGAVLAVLVGLPALRLRGLLLAVTTLAFALAGGSWLVQQDWLVRVEGGVSSLTMPRPTVAGIDFGSELNYFYLCVGLFVLVAVLVAHLRHTGFGRALMAVRDNEAAAATMSISPRKAKLAGFALSGAVASLAGYFYGGLLVNFTEAVDFASTDASLSLLAMVIFGGTTTVIGPLLGAAYFQGITNFLGQQAGVLATGVGLLVVLQMLPGGLASLVFRLRDQAISRLTGEPIGALGVSDREQGIERQPLPPAMFSPNGQGPVPIRAEEIVVRFGGLTAVNGVTIEARQGEIVGLVGPNGAGKTTLFDVLSGRLRPAAGRVLLGDIDVTRLRPEQRTKLALGRTFQEAKLYPELPLIDAIKLALEPEAPFEPVPELFGLPSAWDAEKYKTARAEEVIELLGLTPFAYRNCNELSTGTRRFAELGCLLAMGSRVLLLDEPTAGIAQREVEEFAPVIQEIRDHLGATLIVIEHDIPMIMGIVDRLYVMAAGELIADGPPEVLREDPAVIAAYLGTDEQAIARSGTVGGGPAAEKSTTRSGGGVEHGD